MKNTISEDGKISNEPKCSNTECGRVLDGFTGIGDKGKPASGDLTICLYCAEIMVFNDDLNLESLSIEEYKSLPKHIRFKIDSAQSAIAYRINSK